MVTLTFIFNKEQVEQNGYTENELLQPVREHAKKYNISEIRNGVFFKNGDDALCTVSMMIPLFIDTFSLYTKLLSEWTLNVDGEEEDCIRETVEWRKEHGLQAV